MHTIVLADDDAIFLNGLYQHVPWGALGLKVAGIAEDGVQALALCRARKPDLLLTDVRMPGLNGIESAMCIHEAHPDCHILFMSAYAQPEDYRAAIRLRAVDFLEKPLGMEEVTQALQQAVMLLKDRPVPPVSAESQPSRSIFEVMRYIQEHYMENTAVEDLARIAFFTPNYLSMLFRRETGQTISQYEAYCRIQAAAKLLRGTCKSISEISEAVGYRDTRHFSKIFQKAMGLTPSEYRKSRD